MKEVEGVQERSDVARQALAQVSQLRDMINKTHPGLINKLRQDVLDLPALNGRGEEIVDQNKTRETIEKFLMMKLDQSHSFKAQLKRMLMDT